MREVCDIVQEAVTKIIQRKKNETRLSCSLRRLYKYLRKEDKRKSKRERGKYTQLNAELQRIARKDKKAFFNEQ